MSRNTNVDILRLMLLLETNTGCKNNVANERKTQQVSAAMGQIPHSTNVYLV